MARKVFEIEIDYYNDILKHSRSNFYRPTKVIDKKRISRKRAKQNFLKQVKEEIDARFA